MKLNKININKSINDIIGFLIIFKIDILNTICAHPLNCIADATAASAMHNNLPNSRRNRSAFYINGFADPAIRTINSVFESW